MVRAQFIFVAACLIALSNATISHIAAAASRPNVVLLLVDDMGWMDSGVYGSQYYETPNMAALAKRGMLFTGASKPTSPPAIEAPFHFDLSLHSSYFFIGK